MRRKVNGRRVGRTEASQRKRDRKLGRITRHELLMERRRQAEAEGKPRWWVRS